MTNLVYHAFLYDGSSMQELGTLRGTLSAAYPPRRLTLWRLADGYCGGRTDLSPAYGRGHLLRRLPADRDVTCDIWTARGVR